MGTLPCFSVIFTKGDNYLEFLFTSPDHGTVSECRIMGFKAHQHHGRELTITRRGQNENRTELLLLKAIHLNMQDFR